MVPRLGGEHLDGGAASGFTPANFLASLNAQLGANGSATFAGGVLSISATGGNGVAIGDDTATPSLKAGQGFVYLFDFGDRWWHEVTVEQIGGVGAGDYPRLVEKHGSSPPQYREVR